MKCNILGTGGQGKGGGRGMNTSYNIQTNVSVRMIIIWGINTHSIHK